MTGASKDANLIAFQIDSKIFIGNANEPICPKRLLKCLKIDEPTTENLSDALTAYKMDSSQVKAAFIKLKPFCDTFLSGPTKATLKPLIKECKELNPQVLQEVHAYILFPFTVHLRNPVIKSNDLRMAMVDAMNEILMRTRVDSIEMYFKYFSLMIFQIFDKDSIETALDEDFTLSVVKVMTTLTVRLPNDLRPKLYVRTNATKIGQGIFVCVQIARKEGYRALRLACIHCILAICTLHDDLIVDLHTPKINPHLALCVGDVLMFFLPGLLGAMQDITKGDQKQGHAITCLAIKTISKVLCLTLMDLQDNKTNSVTNDDFVKLIESHRNPKPQPKSKEKPDPFGVKLRAKGAEGMKEHLEKARRNKDWYDAAGEKLTILLKSLLPIQYHPHEKVRKQAALMCLDIITYCPRNMYPSLKFVLEMMVALSEDDTPEITKISRKALQLFTESTLKCDQKHLLDILEDNFNSMLAKLPRYLNKLDVNLQICGLNLMKGYLRLMTSNQSRPQRLTQILSCSYVMNRFAILLVEIFKLESGNIKLLEEHTLRDMETPAMEDVYPWKNYVYLQSATCINNALDVCKILGSSDCIEIIVDYLLEQFRLDNEYKKEIIFILNEILSAPGFDIFQNEHLIKDVINTYIDYENWYLPTTVVKKEKLPGKNETLDTSIYNPREWIKERTFDLYEGGLDVRYTGISYRQHENRIYEDEEDDRDNCVTITQAQNNVMQICLMTEGIGKIAKHMKHYFQPHLLKCLYLILERAGSSIEMIHLAGIRSLTDISAAFLLTHISDLLRYNANYFTHHVNMKLKKITDNAGVIDVLLVVMKYSEAAVLPCLYDIVSNALNQCSRPYPQRNITLFLKLFYTFIIYISSKFLMVNPNDFKICTCIEERNKTVLYCLSEYLKNLNLANCSDEDVPINSDEDLPNIEDEQEYENDLNNQLKDKKEAPAHIKMVVSVLKRTMNFLPSNDREQKLLALDIINEGIVIIKDWEDELLPLVHEIWAPLVIRFKETSQPLIINRALTLLVTFASVSKDFIRKRTTEEVLPSLCEFLNKTVKESTMKDVGSAYRLTQSYKLQLALLESLGGLMISLNLQERSTYEVMTAAQKYLSCKQPKPLQAACMDLFKNLLEHDIGAFWLHLNGLWNDGRVNSAIEDMNGCNFKEFKCPVNDQTESIDYKSNVCTLLDFYSAHIVLQI